MDEQILTVGHDESLARIITLLRGRVRSVEMRYDRADGPPLAEDEELELDEAVAWTATITLPCGCQRSGTHIVPPLGDNGDGALFALADVARLVGIRVTVVDAR